MGTISLDDQLPGNDVSVIKAHWITWSNETWTPFWLGFSIAIGYLLIRCMFDGFFLVTWGFPQGANPLWRSDIWWPELVNATLVGCIPAALLIAHHGIDRDLNQLRPALPRNDAELEGL